MSAPFGGIDWVTVQKAIHNWTTMASGLPPTSVYWGQQDSPRVAEPAIDMKIYAQRQEGEPWLEKSLNVIQVTPTVATGIDLPSSTLIFPSHGLRTGDGPVRLTTSSTMPGGLEQGRDYWVVVVGPNSLRFCATYYDTGGNHPANPVTSISLTSGFTGTLTLSGTPKTIRAGSEILYVARSMERCTLNLECHTSTAVGMDMAVAILHNVVARRKLPSVNKVLNNANVGVLETERVRAIHGMRSATLFEPRALLQVYLSIPSEAVETGRVLRAVSGTDLNTGRPFLVRAP